ncbi:hypothetical protein GALMADRAFT_1038006 [Galerina marginata CBS 339.88]|uniref:Uncharacterized protein n=1 Tax=Galerina marginata (strain CBS 339.88) TaxID=685588 RepID=A0A067SLP2_GALM3|nr:hypothetical protein GALMADRAFT_1038006 [Galerina marginata CBS 339.88]
MTTTTSASSVKLLLVCLGLYGPEVEPKARSVLLLLCRLSTEGYVSGLVQALLDIWPRLGLEGNDIVYPMFGFLGVMASREYLYSWLMHSPWLEPTFRLGRRLHVMPAVPPRNRDVGTWRHRRVEQ